MSIKCQKSFTLTVASLPSLKGYWTFEEGASPWLDSKGLNNFTNLAVHGISTAGKIGNGIEVPISGTVSTPGVTTGNTATILIDPTKGFTVAGWCKRNLDSPSGINFDLFFEWAGNSGFDNPFQLRFSATGFLAPNVFELDLLTPTDHEDNFYGAIVNGTWYFFVIWLDPSDNLLRFQLNDGTINVFSTPIAIAATSLTTVVNVRGSNGNNSGQFVVDELGIWGKVLSALERTNLYNGGAGQTYPNVPA